MTDEIKEAIDRFHRRRHTSADLEFMREHGLVTKPSRQHARLTSKALKILGNEPGRWYCPKHGLNGCDGKPKKNAECTCPHRQEPTEPDTKFFAHKTRHRETGEE